MKNNLHLVLKTTMGPTPQDLAAVETMGRESWLERQLYPERINNSPVYNRLTAFPTLFMTATELLQNYPRPAPGEEPEAGREFRRPFAELSSATLLLARYSESQLLEVMTDFWFNHFNVFGPEGINFWALTPYVMKVIRKHALGKFPNLVMETAKSPAMLFYLDNFLSTREMTLPNGKETGLNENYARELMELHTLGVDAGYTQEDIIAAAKVLTGWSITRPRDNKLEFSFYENLHQRGSKTVFGRTFPDNGMKEGEDMVNFLSLRPETAAYVARKLVSHLVSDNPPEELVHKVETAFLDTGGDIPAMLREIFLSPSFYNDSHFRAKVKTPLRYLISALRTLGAEISDPQVLLRSFNTLGQPLFQCHVPTGYGDKKEAVVSTGTFLQENSLMRRLVFNRVRGVQINSSGLVRGNPGGTELADKLLHRILLIYDRKSASAIREASLTPGFGTRELISLILVSPDFFQY